MLPISGRLYVWGDNAKFAPEKPGVYALYNAGEVPIFVGQSDNLREEFNNYLKTSFSDSPCKGETRFYRRELTESPDERKKQLLLEFLEEHGESPKCNTETEPSDKQTEEEGAFHFYEDMGRPLKEMAVDLEDFQNKIGKIPSRSLEFHHQRGDFARWIHDVVGEYALAESVEGIDKAGEALRKAILDLFDNPEKAECPQCGYQTNPVKTWKMAGRPSKKGERLQLTLGYYKCQECSKAFRKVLAKERVRAT
ncbi:MAG: hypothetical protein NWE81_03380 [Candidatus Bathyarchaeota archaeon]|jgi:DNA-directed RNA polymerase subunit RPC12/RpoP|nr:hypothetical protein [Candidatus Bathyarchaeota archaeon]